MAHSISRSDLLRLADLNLVGFWCESSKWIPHPEILQQDDTVFINSALDFPGCNLAFNLALDATESPDAFLNRVKAFFTGRKRAFSLLLRGHTDDAIDQYCRGKEMFLVADTPGMVLDEPVEEKAIPAGAELHWVENERGLQGFKHVVGEAYQDLAFPREVSESYFTHAGRVLAPQFVFAMVYFEGEPASTALAMLSHGIAGVYWVGTTKRARARGLAEYCTRKVSNAAFALGARKVVLQASRFGEPIYIKMGFREFTRYPWFICSSK